MKLLRFSKFGAANEKAIATKHQLIEDFTQRLARARGWVATHKHAYAAVLAKDELAILSRYKAAVIIDRLPDLKGAFDSSFPLKP